MNQTQTQTPIVDAAIERIERQVEPLIDYYGSELFLYAVSQILQKSEITKKLGANLQDFIALQ